MNLRGEPRVVDWISTTLQTVASYAQGAVAAGKDEYDDSPLWVIRAYYRGDLIPGKLSIKHLTAYILHDGRECPVNRFEILYTKPEIIHWLPGSQGSVPEGAIIGGKTHNGNPLYIGRVKYKTNVIPGKVYPRCKRIFTFFEGKQILFKKYEVLCKILVVDWVRTSPFMAPTYAHRALVAGKVGFDGSPLWVIRAHHSKDRIPGKLAVKHYAAYIPYDGWEIRIQKFELLCAKSNVVHWLPASNGLVPAGAIASGRTWNGERLYIGRAQHLQSMTPGKVHPSHGCMYMAFGGKEISFKEYEVLCKKCKQKIV